MGATGTIAAVASAITPLAWAPSAAVLGPKLGYNTLIKPGEDAKKAAADAADKQQKQVNAQIAAQQAQKTNAQNQSANATAVAQARVRSLMNPDSTGNTIMTPASSAGSMAPLTGKTILGS